MTDYNTPRFNKHGTIVPIIVQLTQLYDIVLP